MHRRQFWQSLGVAGVLTGVGLSAPALAAVKTTTFPAEKFFAYLKNYYELPAAERNLFRMAFFAHADKAKLEEISMSYAHKGKVQPISFGLDGYISPLPTAEAMRDKAQLTITAPENFNLSLSLDLMPAFAPQQSVNVGDLLPAIAQAAKSVKKAAGLMAMAVPIYDTVLFTGVAGGEIVMKDGSRKPLPLKPAFTSKRGVAYPATPYLTPSKWPQAASVQLPAAPHFMLIVPAPKVG